jgi:hypothetical protein
MRRIEEHQHFAFDRIALCNPQIFPLYSQGGKGEPVAKRARPSVQFQASAIARSKISQLAIRHDTNGNVVPGSHSAKDVGLERGMIIGRSTCDAISRTTSSSNARACVEVPIKTVGFTFRTTGNAKDTVSSKTL